MLWALPALAMLDCQKTSYEGNGYTICLVDAEHGDLRLFLYDAAGAPFGHFSALDADLTARGERLVFAMNAGMYHADRSPVGHYVENGQVLKNVIAGAGPGNFGLVPNGIYCIRENRADVIETETFLARRPTCRHATQSGPMLVIDGVLHPRFLPDSTSRYIRNGVGTSADGKTSVFVMSNNAVTFHEFGSLFRDALGLPNALYLDGNVSRLYAPEYGRNDLGRMMGPIVGLVAPRP
jgi:uncharacterized protein YigE (DUF2233 family)